MLKKITGTIFRKTYMAGYVTSAEKKSAVENYPALM
jgi:hypothetical protein